MKKLALVIIVLSQLSFAEYGGGSSGVGVPNPAAKNCVDLGGTLTYGTEEGGGTFALCTLGSVQVEEWTLFRTAQGECTDAARKFLTQGKFVYPKPNPGGAIGMPNPSSVNCVQRGGQNLGVEVKEGADGFCLFVDRTSIGAWSLFRGRNAAGAQQFARIARRACR